MFTNDSEKAPEKASENATTSTSKSCKGIYSSTSTVD